MDLGAPASYLTLAKGLPVYDVAGAHIGAVEHVLADPDDDIFDGIVVDTRIGPGGMRFADGDQVAEVFERGVTLKVGIDQLHDPQPGPGVIEVDPADDESGIARKLRRAWELISGKY
jgi:hypothetical protein